MMFLSLLVVAQAAAPTQFDLRPPRVAAPSTTSEDNAAPPYWQYDNVGPSQIPYQLDSINLVTFHTDDGPLRLTLDSWVVSAMLDGPDTQAIDPLLGASLFVLSLNIKLPPTWQAKEEYIVDGVLIAGGAAMIGVVAATMAHGFAHH